MSKLDTANYCRANSVDSSCIHAVCLFEHIRMLFFVFHDADMTTGMYLKMRKVGDELELE